MQQYLALLRDVLDNGVDKADRTGVGTRSVFGRQVRFDLAEGFPLVTTKRVHVKSVIWELLWFLVRVHRQRLAERARRQHLGRMGGADGDLGPIYGASGAAGGRRMGTASINSRSWSQLIRRDPDSRRLVVSAWNPADLPPSGCHRPTTPTPVAWRLAPCHCLFQFYVQQGRLSCQLYQRSADLFLGVPFNIASYALLTHMLAQQCDLAPGSSCTPSAICTCTKTT
jgi:thymidylate synthase